MYYDGWRAVLTIPRYYPETRITESMTLQFTKRGISGIAAVRWPVKYPDRAGRCRTAS